VPAVLQVLLVVLKAHKDLLELLARPDLKVHKARLVLLVPPDLPGLEVQRE
jgi:hypothetical protein